MAILKLKPACKDYVWGGRRLADEFGIDSDKKILAEAARLEVSDVHLTVGQEIFFRVNGSLLKVGEILTEKNLEKILSELGASLTLHDFRVVPYKSGRKLIFDVAVPENFPLNDRELRREFQRRLIKLHSDDRAIIRLDHQYC